MENNNFEFDTMSVESLPNNLTKLEYKKYSKDDIDIEKGLVKSEVCQICFNIIWDHRSLVCSNKKCNHSLNTLICKNCSIKIYENAYNERIDFTCPFCRSVIIKKEEFMLTNQVENNTLQNNDEELMVVFNSTNRIQEKASCNFLVLILLLLTLYIILNVL